MNAVAVKAPAVEQADFVGSFAQHSNSQRVAIKREKVETCEGLSRRGGDLFVQALVEGKIGGTFFRGDFANDSAELGNPAIELALDRVCGGGIFSDRWQRRERHAGRTLLFEAARHGSNVVAEPFGRRFRGEMLENREEPSRFLGHHRNHVVPAKKDHDLIGTASQDIPHALQPVVGEIAADPEVAKIDIFVLWFALQFANPVERLALARGGARSEARDNDGRVMCDL